MMNNVSPGALFYLLGMQNLLRGVTTCDKYVARFWGIRNMEEYHAQNPLISGCFKRFKKNTTNQAPKPYNSPVVLHHLRYRWDHAQLHRQHRIQLPRQWEAHFQRLSGASI